MAPRHDGARRRMVEQQLSDIADARVREIMLSVPRHAFVESVLQDRAYLDGALPIGKGQTISQPWIVARMTELLQLEPGDKTLDELIGAGVAFADAIKRWLAARTSDRTRALLQGQDPS